MRLRLILVVPALLLIAVVLVPFAGSASTAPFDVNSTEDVVDASPGDGLCATGGGVCTLRAAVQEANASAGADTINVPAGTYALTIPGNHEDLAAKDDLDILDDLIISGAGEVSTIIDGGGDTRIFDIIPNDVVVDISSLTIRNGVAVAGGGGIDNHAALALTDVTITGNTGPEGGGISNRGQLTLEGVTLEANTATDYAGALWNEPGSTAAIHDSTITNNESLLLHAPGGAIFNEGTLVITGSTIENNTSAGSGGGVATAGDLTIAGSSVSNNTGTESGGGIWLDEGGEVTVSDSHIDGNSTLGGGGGVELAGDDQFTITNSTINDNSAESGGGGIDIIQDAPVTVRNTTIANNDAHDYVGGGIAQTTLVPLTIDRVTFSGNTALSGGGISLLYNGPTTITNSTFSGNSVAENGGAIWRNSATPVTVLNSTIAGNSGDGIFTDYAGGTFAFKNTIIANNAGGDCAFANGGHLTSQGHNLASDATCNLNAASDLEETDPKLGPLADNGGDTQTMALLPDSPSIDAGTDTGCPATDQRGIERPADGDDEGTATCDIGAFELVPEPPGTTLTQGDVDCNGVANAVDSLKILRYVAQLTVAQGPDCPLIGAEVASFFGDVDCGGAVNSVDALKVLRFVAQLSVAQTEPCPDIGEGL